jgi:hypothetical protein
MRRWLAAALIVLACSVEMADEYEWETEYDPPTTCAECVTDSECEALCGVGPCEVEGESGCWEPLRVYYPDDSHPGRE